MMASSTGDAARDGGETSTSAAPLHVENANRSVWLLKVIATCDCVSSLCQSWKGCAPSVARISE